MLERNAKIFISVAIMMVFSCLCFADEKIVSISGDASAVSSGDCDFKAGSPVVFHHRSGGNLCTATFECPRSKTTAGGAIVTTAFDNSSCPPLETWPDRNLKAGKLRKSGSLEAKLPEGLDGIDQLHKPETISGDLECRYTRKVRAEYLLVAKDEWAQFTTGEVSCTGPGAENMPPFFACKDNGTAPVKGGVLLIARTVSDCWKEENRLPFTPAGKVEIMTEPEFEHLVEKRRRDSNNTLLTSKDRVAQGQAEPATPTAPGIQHSAQRNPQSLASTTTPIRRILEQ